MYKSLLVLLDLSAALDTIDHRTLLNILESDYGIGGDAIKWFESYLSVRKQQIFINQQLSKPFDLDCEVPQGNCLEPILLLLVLLDCLKYWQSITLKHMRMRMTRNYIFLLNLTPLTHRGKPSK